MKITAPVNKAEEVRDLIEAGADELYCGVYHSEWYYTETRPNAKPTSKSSLKSFKDSEKIVQKAKKYNVPVYITLDKLTRFIRKI
jgi:collagenase-like PrtC family protease